jgi:putative peptidoglycan lipid II flippase
MFPLKVAGLAMASSISAVVNFLILFNILKKRIGDFTGEAIVGYLLKICLSAAIMGLAIHLVWGWLTNVNDILRLGITIGCGVVCFILGCLILRIKELRQVTDVFKE